MKKIGKILSSVLVASMLVSACAMNAMAASKAHTATITPSKTKDLKAGETITVEVTIDNTADLTAVGYTLVFDTKAFTAETAKVSKVEKCIDKDWLTDIKKEDGGSVGDYWAYYLGAPAYNVTVPGEITFSWAGGANGGIGTDDPDNEIKDNRLIGKFNLLVNEDVADGEYTIGLKDDFKVCYTSDAGESQGAQLTATAVSVKVGEDAPELPADRSEAVKFTANANTYVEIKKGEEVKNFFLPTKVDGEATVYGLFKYTVDGTNVAKNDVFTIKAIDTVTKVETDVATVTVK